MDSAPPLKRYTAVDLFKGIAIVGVVLHHVTNRRFDPQVQERARMVALAFTWCVYAFIFVSGFLHSQSRRVEGVIEHIMRRAQRLLVPYLWLGGLYTIVYHCIQKYGLLGDGRTDHIPPTLLGKFVELLKCRPVAGEQLYFFVLLFIVSAMFVVLLQFGGGVRRLLGIVTVLLVGMLATAVVRHHGLQTTGFAPEVILCGLFQYALGYLWGKTKERQMQWLLVSCGGVLGALLLLLIFSRWTLISQLAPLLLMQVLQFADPRHWLSRPFDALGVASSSIFAFHTPFVLQLLLIIFLRLKIPPECNIVLSVCITLLVCVGIHRLLNRYTALHLFRV